MTKDLKKGALIGFLACYLMGAVVFGMSVKRNFPSASLLGASYLGAVWPIWVTYPEGAAGILGTWAFDFKDPA